MKVADLYRTKLWLLLGCSLVAFAGGRQRVDGIRQFRNDRISAGVSIPRDTPPSGLIAAWNFQDNVNDNIGTHHGSSLTNLTFSGGKIGKAGDFNGGYALVIPPDDFRTQSFTVSVWVKTSVSGTYQTIFESWFETNASANNYGYRLLMEPAGCTFTSLASGGGGNNQSTCTAVINDNVWHHLVYSYDVNTNSRKIYVDNVKAEMFTGVATAYSTSTTSIGLLHSNGSTLYPYTGLMDELHVWGRQLSDAEVTFEYNSGVGRTY